MDEKEILKKLRESECVDEFECIFGLFGIRKNGEGFCCRAIYPNGDLNEPKQKCVAHQAADLIESLIAEKDSSRTEQGT